VLSVRDTGPGPAPDDGAPAARGVGLHNTEARLRRMYGDDQPLSLRAAEGGGAVAEIRIPYRPASEAPPAIARAGGD
jgi:LytS/YehU family sensor histidine kinase